MPEGVKVMKWPVREVPTRESVSKEMEKYGYGVYDLQTIPPWFERSRHSHDHDEIRGAVEGVTTFHFDDGPVTIEAGDILFIPAGGSPYLNQEAAAKLIKQINPKIVVPALFKIPGLKTKVGDINEFLEELSQKSEPQEKLVIKKKELPAKTQVMALKI